MVWLKKKKKMEEETERSEVTVLPNTGTIA